MARGKVVAKAKTSASVRKRPVKAGANRKHGGFPTQKIILILNYISRYLQK